MYYTTLFISLHKDILDMDIETVDKFLKEFKDKARVFGIIFRIDRKKNMQALLDLEISAIMREKIIMSLTVEDYYKGPTEDKLELYGRTFGSLASP